MIEPFRLVIAVADVWRETKKRHYDYAQAVVAFDPIKSLGSLAMRARLRSIHDEEYVYKSLGTRDDVREEARLLKTIALETICVSVPTTNMRALRKTTDTMKQIGVKRIKERLVERFANIRTTPVMGQVIENSFDFWEVRAAFLIAVDKLFQDVGDDQKYTEAKEKERCVSL